MLKEIYTIMFNATFIKYGTYAIFAYAAAHGGHDLFRGGKALYRKWQARTPATTDAPTQDQPQPVAAA